MIAKLEAIPLAYPDPNDRGRTGYLCLVKATDDEGRVGWGETWTRREEATRAVWSLLEGIAPLVVGEDPVRPDGLIQTNPMWERW